MNSSYKTGSSGLDQPLYPESEALASNEIFETAKSNAADSYDLVWENINYTLRKKEKGKKEKRQILKSVFGEAKSGEITAIIGQSGAGKTTLLNLLANKLKPGLGKVQGDFYVDNSKINRFKTFIAQNSSYLRQEDTFYDFYTPRQLLRFASKLKLPGPDSSREKVINSLIADLNLKSCADEVVGNFEKKGVSGGEKRRISIGLELMNDPSIIFLDEPTSGLDSFTTLLVMGILKKQAK